MAYQPTDYLNRLYQTAGLSLPRMGPAGTGSLTPEEEESLLQSLAGTSLSGLQWVGETLDSPGSAIRGLLGTGDPQHLLRFIPGVETLVETIGSPWGYELPERVTGREMLRNWGVLNPRGQDTWGNFAGGLGAEILLDPLTYVSLGTSAAASQGGKMLAKAGLKGAVKEAAQEVAARAGSSADDIAKITGRRAALGMGKKTTVRDVAEYAVREAEKLDPNVSAGFKPSQAIRNDILAAANRVGAGKFNTYDEALNALGDEAVSEGFFRVGVPFTPFQKNIGGPVSRALGGAVDDIAATLSGQASGKVLPPIGRFLRSRFDSTATKGGKEFALAGGQEWSATSTRLAQRYLPQFQKRVLDGMAKLKAQGASLNDEGIQRVLRLQTKLTDNEVTETIEALWRQDAKESPIVAGDSPGLQFGGYQIAEERAKAWAQKWGTTDPYTGAFREMMEGEFPGNAKFDDAQKDAIAAVAAELKVAEADWLALVHNSGTGLQVFGDITRLRGGLQMLEPFSDDSRLNITAIKEQKQGTSNLPPAKGSSGDINELARDPAIVKLVNERDRWIRQHQATHGTMATQQDIDRLINKHPADFAQHPDLVDAARRLTRRQIADIIADADDLSNGVLPQEILKRRVRQPGQTVPDPLWEHIVVNSLAPDPKFGQFVLRTLKGSAQTLNDMTEIVSRTGGLTPDLRLAAEGAMQVPPGTLSDADLIRGMANEKQWLTGVAAKYAEDPNYQFIEQLAKGWRHQAKATGRFLQEIVPEMQRTGATKVFTADFARAMLQDAINTGNRVSDAFATHKAVAQAARVGKPQATTGEKWIHYSDLYTDLKLTRAEAESHLATELRRMGKITPDQHAAMLAGEARDILNEVYIPESLATDLKRHAVLQDPSQRPEVLAWMDKFLNLEKASFTTPWPAFHMRNLATAIYRDLSTNGGDLKSLGTVFKRWGAMRALLRGKVAKNLREIIPEFKSGKYAGMTDEQLSMELLNEMVATNSINFSSGEALDVTGGLAGARAQAGKSAVEAMFPGRYGNELSMRDWDVTGLGMAARDAATGNIDMFRKGEVFKRAGRVRGGPGQSAAERASRDPTFRAGENLTSYVENLGRGSTYIARRILGESPEEAAAFVKAAHVAYDALTPFEKRVVKRWVPFYTYSRHIIPSYVSEFARKPSSSTSQLVKAQSRQDEYTPKQAVGAFPLGGDENTMRFLKLDLPQETINDIFTVGATPYQTLRQTGTSMLSMLRPEIKAPLEVATGQSFFQKGRPLTELHSRIGSENPLLNQLAANAPTARAISTAGTWADDRKGFVAKALNTLTGARVTDVDREQQMLSAAQGAASDLLREGGAQMFSRPYFPEGYTPSEDELELMKALNAITQRRRERKKTAAGL